MLRANRLLSLLLFLNSQALIDQLDLEAQTRKHAFSTGKVIVETGHPQADVTVIHAFETAEALQAHKECLLQLFNQSTAQGQVSLSLRVLEPHQLRLVLFGDFNHIQAFLQETKKISP